MPPLPGIVPLTPQPDAGTTEKSLVAVTATTVAAALGLVMVMTWLALKVVCDTLPKLNNAGEAVSPGVPVPVKLIGAVGPFEVMIAVPGNAPVAVGKNPNDTVQLLPGATATQLCEATL